MNDSLVFVAIFCVPWIVSATNSDRPEKLTPPVKVIAAAEDADITGYYACKGDQGDGKMYEGITMIRRVKSVYLVQWMTGDLTVLGVGHRHEDLLSVGWAYTSPGGPNGGLVRGVTVYRILGKTLAGRFQVIPGPAKAMTETLTRLRGLEEVK